MIAIITSSHQVKDKNYYVSNVIVFEKNYGEWDINSDSVFSSDLLKASSIYQLEFNRKGRLIESKYLCETDIPQRIIKAIQEVNK